MNGFAWCHRRPTRSVGVAANLCACPQTTLAPGTHTHTTSPFPSARPPCAALLLQAFCGLILVSPCCQRPGWWEWAWGHVAARQLQYQGWVASVKQYFVQRLFGELMQNAMAGESDLLQVGRFMGWAGRQGSQTCCRWID